MRRPPDPPAPGLQIALDPLQLQNPTAGQATPSDFTDVSFLKELESSGIRVAQYLTELPPREILEKRFHEAIVAARARLG